MIEKIVQKFASEFTMEQEFIDHDTDLLLITTCRLGNRVIYTHEFDLSPMYESFKKRLEEETT